MATRVDGYIADSQDDVDWLEPFNAVDYGYERFIKEIRTVVLGRKTYEQTRGFGTAWVSTGKRGPQFPETGSKTGFTQSGTGTRLSTARTFLSQAN